MNSENRTILKASSIILIVFVAFFAGYNVQKSQETNASTIYDDFLLPQEHTMNHDNIDLESFWLVWDEIDAKYVTSEMPTDEEKVYAAISGLVSSLEDPYSTFFPPVESKLFEEEVQGNFSGVGMEVGMRNMILTVIAPLKGTPAEKAGILPEDTIIAIDATSTFDLNINEAVTLIRGERGTPVVLSIVREGEEDVIDITIIRDTIDIPTIDTELRDDGIFVISLYSFSATAPDLFRQSLREFVESGSDNLIVDLRGNPGGYFSAAVDIASWFLPTGNVVARESFGGDVEETLYRSKGYNIFGDSLNLVILMNGGSASASEILAGALREHDKATIIGTQSFGKGSVQELIEISANTSLKLTIARWLTPDGISISEEGLTPDIETAITIDEFKAGEDPQMDTAVEFLKTTNKEEFITKYKEDNESNT